MVDDPAHLDVVDEVRTSDRPVRVAIDVDAGLFIGGQHVGPKRSPVHDPGAVVALARTVLARPGFDLVGVMTYEGQVAGVPDAVPRRRARSLVVRRLKAASLAQLETRRREIARAIAELTDLELWNAGGSGSVDATDPRPGGDRGGRRVGAAGPGALRPLPVLRPAPGRVLRRARGPSALGRASRPSTAAASSPPGRPVGTGCRSRGRPPAST